MAASKMTTEEIFYDHLTLGLLKVLNSIPRVTNVVYERRIACERTQVTAWEQRHNIYLPDDMKRFYLSTDGFHLYWSYKYSNNDVRKVGQIYIPHLIEISLMRENIELNDPSLNSSLTYLSTLHRSAIAENQRSPTLNARSKIFELKSILDMAKVCLVYESPESNPKIFLFEVGNLKWKFLADSFSEYLRMCIAHMGLPYWELCFSSSCQLPPWTEQLFLLLAPHLLEKNEPRRSLSVKQNSDCPIYNVLETAVFRAKPTKCSRQNPKQKKF